jgi:hypothetical protein
MQLYSAPYYGEKNRKRDRERILKKERPLGVKYIREYAQKPIVVTCIRVCLTKSEPCKAVRMAE